MRALASLIVAGGLFAGGAQAAVLIDFGTDPGQTNNTTSGFSIWGGWGFALTGGVTRTFSGDSMNTTYTPTGAWSGAGQQYVGTLLNGINLTGVDPAGKLAMEARFIMGTPAPDFYVFRTTLIAVDGSTSGYSFITSVRTNPTPFSYGTDPATVPFTVVEATTDMAHPTSSSGGGFSFAADTLAEIDILYQAGLNGTGSFTTQIDNIQVPVPEPASLAMGLLSAPFLLRRRRA